MEYKYCEKTNFEDYASGRVIYGNAGIPNYPVRLMQEIFGRSLEYMEKKEGLTVYDPCCGGGYLLTVLGLCNSDTISRLIGSDIDSRMVEYAKKNLSLLTEAGMNDRIDEIEGYIKEYQKQSHVEAKESAVKLKSQLKSEMTQEVFQADCTKNLPIQETVDLIITDIPYGNLVSWQGGEADQLSAMLHELAEIASENTVLALSMDKKQKVELGDWRKLESQKIGKRKFLILGLACDGAKC